MSVSATSVGVAAGILTSTAAIPQVIKAVRTRRTMDISIWQPLFLAIGVALWLIYGTLIGDLPLILANIIPLVCNVTLCALKLHYDRNADCSQNNSQPIVHTPGGK